MTVVSRTKTDDLYDRVRAEIMGGRLPPGDRLKFPDFPQRFNASVGAAREVLVRLSAEGLVATKPRRGYVVTPLSHRDLAELTEARIELESLVLGLSIRDGDMEFEAQAVAAHHVLERTIYLDTNDPSHPTEEWASAHAQFHRSLLLGCRNRRLLDKALSLREEAQLYLAWSVAFGEEGDRDILAEHRRLLDVTVTRDAEGATQHLRDHIAHTAQLVIKGAPDQPNPPRANA